MKTKKEINYDSIRNLVELAKQFDKERGWDNIHGTSMMSISLVAEVGELMEHFLWNTDSQISKKMMSPEKKKLVGEEMCDILFHLLILSYIHDIDLPKAFEAKMKKNVQKYPVTKGKGVTRYKNM